MYHLATVFPIVRRLRRFPLTRDQVMLLLMAVNMFFLGVDTYLAHSISGTIRPNEWIPILFGPTAGVLLLVAGLVAFRRRMAANLLASSVFGASMLVGALGAWFHLHRALQASAPAEEQVSLAFFVWAPPVLGPVAFCLVGLLGLSAVWQESPPDSGILLLPGGRRLRMPAAKTQAYFYLVGIGFLVALLSSTLDHARTGFVNPWFWVPFAGGIFATAISVLTGFQESPTRSDLLVFTGTMLAMMAVGALGAGLHILADLSSQAVIVPERFLRGAPFMAPLLFANFGMLGLTTLLSPGEEASSSET